MWFDGPLILSGAIANGGAVLAALAAGADLAYVGSPFIATDEADAPDDYKQAIVERRGRHRLHRFLHRRSRQLHPRVDRAPGSIPDKLGGAPRRWSSGPRDRASRKRGAISGAAARASARRPGAAGRGVGRHAGSTICRPRKRALFRPRPGPRQDRARAGPSAPVPGFAGRRSQARPHRSA